MSPHITAQSSPSRQEGFAWSLLRAGFYTIELLLTTAVCAAAAVGVVLTMALLNLDVPLTIAAISLDGPLVLIGLIGALIGAAFYLIRH
jgi:hypothetical protein